MFDNQRIFISGATGSWGQMLVRQLLTWYKPKEIVCFSRGELQQVLMARQFNDSRLRFVIGDVRDYSSVKWATRDIDTVFHLAALKHVPICEDHPQEAIKTNITGTVNIINAALANGIQKVIDVSTDKAVEPVNTYGMTKAVGEKLILQANSLGSTKFVCVRGGNVMGSNGSVIPYFVQQIKTGGPVTITDHRMTRFFLTLEEAINLLFKAATVSTGGETFVMRMPSCYIHEIAQELMRYHGTVDVREIGAKPGEKLDEILIGRNESDHAHCYDNTYYVILPNNADQSLTNQYGHLPLLPWSEYSSKSSMMSSMEIQNMLQKGGFI